MARSRPARCWAVSGDSIRPPRPRRGIRRTSLIRVRASAVRASAYFGAGARFRQPFMASATSGWRVGCRPSACRRRRGSGISRPGVGQWKVRRLPGGPGTGPRPPGWRAVPSGHRRRPTSGTGVRRRRTEALRVLSALASRIPEATASAASRPGAGIASLSWSWGIIAKPVVMGSLSPFPMGAGPVFPCWACSPVEATNP